jgi:hypothetical protein
MPLPGLTSAASGLMMLASTLAPCPSQGTVEVKVALENTPPPVSTAMTAQQLTQKFGSDLDTTLSTDGKWMISGLTRSNISSKSNYSFKAIQNTQTGATCFVVDKVNYTIVYAPEIYIASDYKNMGCRYSATMMHEKRHVKIDTNTITDFMPQMEKKIKAAAEALGPQGPYPSAQMETEKQRMMSTVDASLKPIIEELVTLRRQRQGTIDTEADYRRDTAVCPGQFPKFDGGQ